MVTEVDLDEIMSNCCRAEHDRLIRERVDALADEMGIGPIRFHESIRRSFAIADPPPKPKGCLTRFWRWLSRPSIELPF